MTKIGDILKIINRLIPEGLAKEWDNSGLQAGSLEWPAKGIILSLDPDLHLLEKARRVDANIAITHHPLIFNPLKRLDLGTPLGKIIERAVNDRIALYSCHTNLDGMEGGVNDILAEKVGLINKTPLGEIGRAGELKKKESIDSISKRLKRGFSLPHLAFVGSLKRTVKRVGVCGGSGSSLIGDAARNGLDLLITGDVRYHAAKEAEALGLSVIDIGHFASESVILPYMASLIRSKLEKEGIDIDVHIHFGDDPLKVI